MRIEFTIIDDHGKRYSGATDLRDTSVDPTHGAQAAIDREKRPKGKDTVLRGLPDHILNLRESGFFREPRPPSEVHEKLQETYSCLAHRVQMALLRLQRRRELRKTVKRVGDQEKIAYVW